MPAISEKKEARSRRAKKTRAGIKKLQRPRLTVHRTPKHIYAQIILRNGVVKAYASTLDKDVKQECSSYSGNASSAKIVGKFIASKAKIVGIVEVAFDRSGFKYHGRIKELADAAREHGLVF